MKRRYVADEQHDPRMPTFLAATAASYMVGMFPSATYYFTLQGKCIQLECTETLPHVLLAISKHFMSPGSLVPASVSQFSRNKNGF